MLFTMQMVTRLNGTNQQRLQHGQHYSESEPERPKIATTCYKLI